MLLGIRLYARLRWGTAPSPRAEPPSRLHSLHTPHRCAAHLCYPWRCVRFARHPSSTDGAEAVHADVDVSISLDRLCMLI